MRRYVLLVAIILLSALGLALGASFYEDSRSRTPQPRAQWPRPAPAPTPAWAYAQVPKQLLVGTWTYTLYASASGGPISWDMKAEMRAGEHRIGNGMVIDRLMTTNGKRAYEVVPQQSPSDGTVQCTSNQGFFDYRIGDRIELAIQAHGADGKPFLLRAEPFVLSPPPMPEPESSQSALSEAERRTLIRYATAEDLRASSAPEMSGKRLHQILDDGLASDSLLVAGVIVMHEGQNHSTKSPMKCWNTNYVAKMMEGAPHYSGWNALLIARSLWNFEQVEGCKDLALDLMTRHDHLHFEDKNLRAGFHKTIGLCKRDNPRYSDHEARREFFTASAIYSELGDHENAAVTKLEEIKALMAANDVVRDREELKAAFAACKTLLAGVAKENGLWGRYWFIEGRFHRDVHTATNAPAELILSERLLRDAIMHKQQHKAEKDNGYYNLLTIHAEACLILATTRRIDIERNLRISTDALLEVINGNSSELSFHDYRYALTLLKTAYAASRKFPLYVELLQHHNGRKSNVPGLVAAVDLELERIRRQLEEESNTREQQPVVEPH